MDHEFRGASSPVRATAGPFTAGGQPISWVSLRSSCGATGARQDTVQQVIEIVLTDRLLKEE